ncbi:MoxR family ATPase [Kineosporia sp. A_224]|uniref:AAA family ATPase n=1 Tax=Kineosporia sp. A_224 TaxID=1962180 RepID=UPI000B4C17A8|nr:MoxR family ATPase [Kineosporia sp. A_224]
MASEVSRPATGHDGPAARAAGDQSFGAGEFADVEDVVTRFAEVGYLADRRLATTVFLQSRLGRPVLLEGPAGVGKTQLAATLAAVTGRRLLRLQCYEGQDETKALYEWDYGKQLLYTQLLRDKISEVVADTTTIGEAVARIGEQDSAFFSETFLAARPLLEAVRSPEPVVLLVDEIDRADEALEAVLLELLAEFQVSVPELGTFRAVHQPYVILTSNTTRDLSAALKRRCLHLYLDYPSPERELEIVRSKDTGLPDALARRLVDVVRSLRGLDLRKAPSISETVDWARTLAVLGVEELTAAVLSDTANVVLKYQRDLQRALDTLPAFSDPNAVVPSSLDAHAHGHGHAHGPGHSHGPGEPHHDHGPGTHAHAEDGDVDGRAVRAAKDRPGRHDEAYYGSPTAGEQAVARRTVGPGQGGRSFAAALGRKGSGSGKAPGTGR